MKPKVFINSINKNIKNNKDVYYYKKDDIDMIDDSNDVKSKIKDIFNSTSFVYKCRVDIILKDRSHITEDVIAIKDDNLITLSDNKIPISNILDIKKAK